MIDPLALSLVAGGLSGLSIPWLINVQRRDHAGQHIYEDAPKTHAAKQGTPTLGGVVFALAAIAGFLVVMLARAHAATAVAARELPLLALMLATAGIGFVDDLLILRAQRALGLRARAKFALVTIAAILYVAWISRSDPHSSVEFWFSGPVVMPYAWWFILSVCAIVGAANAVNLTDGLDGLAAATVLPTLVVLQLPLHWPGTGPTGVGLAVIGACLVFLWFNRHPAKIFMGDTGSLALGALLAGLAIQAHLLLVLPIFGAIFVIETLSVILQVASFKTLHRRIFRMSPLHHHFELSGWREPVVTATFVAAQVMFAAITWLAVRACASADFL